MKLYLVLLSALLTGMALQAQLPQKFNYQAVVRSNAGTIVANQNVRIRFRIHDGTASGTVQYSETHNTTTNVYGLINLQVGAGTVVSGIFTGVTWNTGNKFLEIEADITGGTNYTSLATVELITVPYALQADNANKFSGSLSGDVSGLQSSTSIQSNAVTTAKMADNAVTSAKVASNAINTTHITDNAITNIKMAANAVNTPQIADNAVTSSKVAANAINTTHIADNAVTTTHFSDNAVSTSKVADNAITATKIATGAVVKSINGLKDDITLAAGTGTTFNTAGNTITINGSVGDITSITAGAGLTGGGAAGALTIAANFAGSGSANTVSRTDHNHVGQTWSTNTGSVLTMYDHDAGGIPLNIYSYGTGYNAAGISAQVMSTTGQSVGVFGATNSSDAYAAGIFGQATRAGAAKAVWGYAPGNNTYAIYGDGAGTGSYAGFFQGRVHVNGTLSKSAGSFKIDHPLDPANKFLSHSFVESPDMMNIYDGNVTLDANGAATVTMPDWFEALNKDFRYQLTAIGKPSPNIYIAQEIAGNRFRIAGGAPGGKISWLVTGVRHDAYANAHRIPVEEPKPVNERGTYLNPQAFGKSSKQGVAGLATPLRSIEPAPQADLNK